MIGEFKGEFYFLSNFYESDVTYGGITYRNNEAAFQAQKTTNKFIRMKFHQLNPSDAKKLGRQVHLREDWEQIKDQVMYEICKAKFEQNPDLRAKLLATGDEILVEGNTWGDRIWGAVHGVGENRLGRILMRVRSELCTSSM